MSAVADYKRLEESNLRSTQKVLAILEDIGEMEEIGYIYVSSWGPRIELKPAEGVTARSLALAVIARLKAIGLPPTLAKKSFDKDTGTVKFTIPVVSSAAEYNAGGALMGREFEIAGGEPRCKIKKVVETIEVPEKIIPARVEAARTETKVRFEIENPEECGAEVEG